MEKFLVWKEKIIVEIRMGKFAVKMEKIIVRAWQIWSCYLEAVPSGLSSGYKERALRCFFPSESDFGAENAVE